MIRSMTAFARAERDTEWGAATWELRSVNNRYLDIVSKLPEDLKRLEPEVRERVRSRLHRGKVDCHLRVTYQSDSGAGFELDREFAMNLITAARKVEELIERPEPVNAIDILRWPGVIRPRSVDFEKVAADVLRCLDDALLDLEGARGREGDKILAMLQQRMDAIRSLVADARSRAPDALEAAHSRLMKRLSDLEVEVNRERLEQEMAIAAQKADTAEELDRLEAHLAEVDRILGNDLPAAGRRLDFLMQELTREANTLGAKSIDAGGTLAGVDLKVLIEQMREQIQNVE